MNAHVNANTDWPDRVVKSVVRARDASNRTETIVPRLALQDVGPYIEILRAEGHIPAWSPASAENVKLVTSLVRDRLDIGSVRGLSKASNEYAIALADAALFRDAVQFYAACCIMLERTGMAWDPAKLRTPLHWIAPMLRTYDEATDEMIVPTILIPIQKREQHVPLMQASGLTATVRINCNMKTILAAAKPVPVKVEVPEEHKNPAPNADSTAPNAGTGGTASGQSRATSGATSGASAERPTLTLATLLSAATSLMAKAGWIVSGDNADALHDFLVAYAEAHPLNRAKLLEIATTTHDKPADKPATDTGTTIDGTCQEITPPLAIEQDYTPSADVIEIADHVGNAIAA